MRQLHQSPQQPQAVKGTVTPGPKGVVTKDKCVQQQQHHQQTSSKPSSQATQQVSSSSSSSSVGQPQAQHGQQPVPKKQVAKRTRPFCQQQQQQQVQGAAAKGKGKCAGHSHSVASTQTPPTDKSNARALDVDSATESNGETSLSIAAASGHYEVVEFLIARKAHIEHRDKKGYTPLILAADGGHEKVVELLLNNGADIEAQSERTKDTALSLACTKGRYEVVELLLKRAANKEHRNVSDYTPLSLAASGGYVNIIKLLLQHGAEINSRTGSKLGISPLMLAAMNGNTAAVKLLLDMGSDINAQIETNKNTALTLACFQGRHEVVQLLLERKANLEHRAKTGLTPLMEAANGGYVEVGKILIEKGAEVNAAPVPATRDTALTIAADKGHYRFVELLLNKGAIVDARNKKGCTPLWLACHGGHLDVAQILFRNRADLDSQDNRKISCLMAAFRKGHVKVIRWIVKNVQQFPSDQEMSRYILGLQNEPDLLKRCQQCAEYIKQAKDKQALEANKNATILLEELDMEKSREESKRLAAQRRREKKKKKKKEKKQQLFGQDDDDDDDDDNQRKDDDDDDDDDEIAVEIIDSGIDANSQGSSSSATQDSKRQRGDSQPPLSNKGKGGNKENQKQIPPQKSASNKSVSSNASAPTPPLPDLMLSSAAPEESQQTSSSKSARKKKNRSNKASNVNSTTITSPQSSSNHGHHMMSTNATMLQVDSENNNEHVIQSKNLSNSSSRGTKENQNQKTVVTNKGSSKFDKDNVLKEKVREVEVESGVGVGKNKKDKKNRDLSSSVADSKTKEKDLASVVSESHISYKSSSVSATSHGMSGASVNKKVKGGLETNPVPEPLMGISLSPSQLKKAGTGGVNTGVTSVYSDHEAHSVFTSPSASSTTSSSSSGATGQANKSLNVANNNNINSVVSASNQTTSSTVSASATPGAPATNNKAGSGRKDDGWKEVTRNCPSSRSKKVIVPSSVISRVIGRGGCNINAIREATGAHIEVEKQQKGQVQPERTIQIKGSAEATKQAHNLITALMNEPDLDVKKLLPIRTSSSGTSVTPTPPGPGAFPVISSVTSLLQQQQQQQPQAANTLNNTTTPTVPGQQQQANAGATTTGTTGTSSSNLSTPVDIIIPQTMKTAPFGTTSSGKGGAKGSPTQRTIIGSGSPPLTAIKSGSPPIKKPVVVSSQQNQRNISKRSIGMHSSSSNTSQSTTTGTFVAKLLQQQPTQAHNQRGQDSQWDNRQMSQRNSNSTPTPVGSKRITPTSGMMSSIQTSGTPVTLSPTPPPPATSSSPSQTSGTTSQNSHNNRSAFGVPPQQQQQQQQQRGGHQDSSSVTHSGMSNGPLGILANGMEKTGPNSGDDSQLRSSEQQEQQQQFQVQPPRNLAPGSNPNSTSQSSSRSTGGLIGDMASGEPAPQQQRTPLEYSPFNYTFSKTAGWFPGDLATRENTNSGGVGGMIGHSGGGLGGPNNLMSGSTTSLNSSVARAMNFASVAASGISTTLSTSQAQMSQAGSGGPMQNGGNMGVQHSHGGLQGLQRDGQVGKDDNVDMNVPKADVSKAPGYRGLTSMGSPILRMQQQQQQAVQSSAGPQAPGGGFGGIEGPLSSHFAAAAGITTNPGLMNYNTGRQQSQPPQQQGFGGGGQHYGQDVMSQQMLFSGNSGEVPVAPPVPTNVVLSSRLNPRAPSFNLPMNKVQASQQQQIPNQSSQGIQSGGSGGVPGSQAQNVNQQNVAFQQQSAMAQQNQFNSAMHQHQLGQQQSFKGMGGGGGTQYPGVRPGGNSVNRAVGGNAPNHGMGGWNAYGGAGNVTDDAIMNFPAFAALAAQATNIVDAIGSVSGMDPITETQTKMDDRRLPRPIGGERAWKQSSGSGGGPQGVNAGGLATSMGGLPPFSMSPLDCIESGALPQSMGVPSSGGNPIGPQQQGPAGPPWMNLNPYMNASPSAGTSGGFPSVSQGQQPPPPPGHMNQGSHGPPGSRAGGSSNAEMRNILGSRFLNELDVNRMTELQKQVFEGQYGFLNGANLHPLLMQNAPHPQQPMYSPYGLEHLEQPQHNLPKVDQHSTWDTQALMMEDKILQGGWGASQLKNNWNN
ncbi:Ankyrin repeat and KH domain-containing protein mask [Orchesella cincta]|uniref:Ankyrin repeat and KH domain-containing protein mask n=1 Tax=Orchesella cincta TaxID=48709 RepID=A0A1D2MQV1_ORCCI|nr:Ankyrin repeat and KH domain-containing protein mask [Orchesella cincta]